VIALHLEVGHDRSGSRSEGPGRGKGEEASRIADEQETVEVDLEDRELSRALEREDAAGDEGGFLGEDVLGELVRLAHRGGGSTGGKLLQGMRCEGPVTDHEHGDADAKEAKPPGAGAE
jgi:hypothetical protein